MRKRAGAPLLPEEDRANEPAVMDLIRRVENFRSESIGGVFALVGPWGSGKTSLADATTSRLVLAHGWKTATFEPWAYSDYPSMLDGFFRTLRNQLGTKRLNNSAQKTLSKFFRSVAPLGSIGGMFGVPLQSVLSGIASTFAKREDFLEMRAAANELFARSPHPILIVIEDIDRLDSVELINCFKLIRLLGELDNVYYLLCYDEQTVIDVMQKTDVIGTGGVPRARAYLEKITQVRVDVLDLYGTEQKSLWDRELALFVASNSIKLLALDRQRLQQMWDATFEPYLRSPRALNRFSLQISSTWHQIAGEVNLSDFVAITFLRTFETEVFHAVRGGRDQLIIRGESENLSKRELRGQIEKHWLEKIESAGSKDPGRIFALLSLLFRDLTGPGAPFRIEMQSRSMNIDSALYFDRYFRNSLAVEDLPERSYRAYLDDVAAGEYCPVSFKVLETLNTRDQYIWERLEAEVSDRDQRLPSILQEIVEQYAHIMAAGCLRARLDEHLVRFALRLEPSSRSYQEQMEWFKDISALPGGVAMIMELLTSRWHYDFLESENQQEKAFALGLIELVKKRVEAELNKRPDVADHSVLRGLILLRQLLSRIEMQEFIHEALAKSTLWDNTDLVTALLVVDVEHTAAGPQFYTGSFSLKPESLEEYLGSYWFDEQFVDEPGFDGQSLRWTTKRPTQTALRKLASSEIRRVLRDRQRQVPKEPAPQA